MKLPILFAAAVVICSPVAAQRCDVAEYVQYKERVQSTPGLITLAYAYCRNTVTREYVGAGRAAAECDAEQGKISDALTAAKQHKVLAFAQRGCPKSEEFPDTSAPKTQKAK